MYDMNAKPPNTSQGGLYLQGTGPNLLFLVAACKCFWEEHLLVITALCACTKPLRSHVQAITSSHNTHHGHVSNFSAIVVRVCPFQLLSSLLMLPLCRVIPGSVTLIQVQMDIKGPQILNLHLFPSSEGQPPEQHLTHCTRIEQGPGAGFLTSVRATFLCRRETTLGKYSTGPLGFSS